MFKNMGMPNGMLALYTSLLYLPWVIKPLWSPFVDIIKSKRWWIVAMQILMSAAMLLLPFLLPEGDGASFKDMPMFYATLAAFWVTAFASATHDIAADGFYMHGLSEHKQAEFVGIRSTFYRLSSIFGQGVLVALAGWLETRTSDVHFAWKFTLILSAAIFAAVTIYHTWSLPRPQSDKMSQNRTAGEILKEFARTFVTFFKKKYVGIAMLFMLLYRLPEAFLVKMMNPFLLDSIDAGGLGLSTEAVGIVYGTVGVAALTAGGILGGIAASRWGLKRSLWPMALSLPVLCVPRSIPASEHLAHKHLRRPRSVRLRLRIHSLYALPYIFLGGRIQDCTLLALHGIYGPEYDASGSCGRLLAGSGGLHDIFHFCDGLLPGNSGRHINA